MTVSDNYAPKRDSGNGIVTLFSFPFDIFSAEDLVVYKVDQATNIGTLQVLNTDYTVVINPTTEGGTITYAVAPTSSQDSLITRETAVVQPTVIPAVGQLQKPQLENEYDRSRKIDQETLDKIGRQFTLSVFDSTNIPGFNFDFPTPTGNAGKAVIYNSTEDGFDILEVNLADLDAAIAATEASAAAAAVSEANAATSETNAAISAANAAASAASVLLFGSATNVVVRADTSGTQNVDFIIEAGAHIRGAVSGTSVTLQSNLTLDASNAADYDDGVLSIIDTSYAFVIFLDSNGINAPIARFVKEGNVNNANITYPAGYDDFKRLSWGHCDNLSDNINGGPGTITWFAFRNNRLEFDAGSAVFNMFSHAGTTADTIIDFSQYRPPGISRMLLEYVITVDLTVATEVGNAESGLNARSSFIYAANQAGGTEARIQKEVQLSGAGTYILRNGSNTQNVAQYRVGWYDNLEKEE